jgi:hypothetical protein
MLRAYSRYSQLHINKPFSLIVEAGRIEECRFLEPIPFHLHQIASDILYSLNVAQTFAVPVDLHYASSFVNVSEAV